MYCFIINSQFQCDVYIHSGFPFVQSLFLFAPIELLPVWLVLWRKVNHPFYLLFPPPPPVFITFFPPSKRRGADRSQRALLPPPTPNVAVKEKKKSLVRETGNPFTKNQPTYRIRDNDE